MKVITCYTPGLLRPQTAAALAHAMQLRPEILWEIWPLNPDDFRAYGDALQGEWWRREGFAVVEPDIVIRPDVADAFIDCPEPYCAFPYPWLTDVGPALGCTRFRREFLEAFPTAMDEVQAEGVSWQQVDVVLMRHVLARKYGQQPHVHLPAVEHLNPAKQLLPEASPVPLMQVPHW